MYFKPQHYHLLQSQNTRLISAFLSRKSSEGYPRRNGTGSEENLRVRFLEGCLYGKASLWFFCVISRDIRGFTCSLQQFLWIYWLILLDNQLYEKQSWFTSFCLSCLSFSFVERISNLHQITELYSEPLNKDQIHLIRTNNKFVFDLGRKEKPAVWRLCQSCVNYPWREIFLLFPH